MQNTYVLKTDDIYTQSKAPSLCLSSLTNYDKMRDITYILSKKPPIIGCSIQRKE